ncbi:MAG: 6-phosphofructokinase [Defluviitaleaceae bacterium]|nr:6-phosphofructokinase [Defluviitaleaceae bacterium]
MRIGNEKKRVGLLTSGGDAPGMNACIRGVVRTAMHYDIEVLGIRRGYDGLMAADFITMAAKDVSDIIHRGGTILHTARCEEMHTDEGLAHAAQVCRVLQLDVLIVVGGDGSITGASELAARGVNIIGIPATIDLDFPSSDYTIGFDTAVNTGMEAINRIRDTSAAHERVSVVEVMGRNCGYLALWCGISGGAEEVVIPENPVVDTDAVIRQIMTNRGRGKRHNLVLVAEGAEGCARPLSEAIERVTGIESRATILGHLQRGGSPTALDRMHGSLMGHRAVEVFMSGARNRVIIHKNNEYLDIDVGDALSYNKPYSNDLYDIIKMLSI